MAVQLNKTLINARLKSIYDGWNNATVNDDMGSIANADALLLLSGDPAAEDEPIRKGTAFQTWLLGYEFPSTFLLFDKQKMLILCSATKAKVLQQIKDGNPPVPIEILVQAKAKEAPSDAVPKFIEAYSKYTRVATLIKETYNGKLINEWNQGIDKLANKPEQVDMAPALSTTLAVKDEDELKIIRTAANLTSTLLIHHIVLKLETILDKEAKITHEQFAGQIESRIGTGDGEGAKGPDMKVWSKGRGLSDVDWGATEFCYTPIIQSRSTSTGYDLRSTAESSMDHIAHKGVFLIAVGLRYKGYCANLGRSIIVDPSKEQERIYNLLVSLQSEVVREMKDGKTLRDMYQFAAEYIREKKPDLEKNFVKNLGSGIGIEFRDSAYVLSLKNGRQLKTNMVFNLVLGFSDLVDESGKKYALHLVDTVRVGPDRAAFLTDGVKSSKETLFFLNTAEEDEKPSKVAKAPPAKPIVNVLLKRKCCRRRPPESRNIKQTCIQACKPAGLAKYSEEGGGLGEKEGKGWKRFQSYKGEGALPKEAETLRPFEDPDATFVRSVTYRSVDGHRFDQISKQITDLKKEVNKREQQKKEMADVIEQDVLVEIKGRRPHKLPEVFVRPALDGKRLPGEVEIHQNWFAIPIAYGLPKNRAPIMIGKKKAHDIQFFREASDVQFDETGNRKRKHRYGDEDEIEMEQQERRRRQMLNKEFKLFAERVAEAASTSTGETVEVDIPFRELSFEGVPFRTNVRLQPTTECLVHLIDPPFLVVTLNEIEIASLERVQFTLKQFDLVLVFKDFTKTPLHINSIPSAQLDDVKNWLDSVDIPLSEGPVNLNWGPIMKTINENPHDFFQQGGWSFLGGGGAESDAEEESDTESEFEADPEDLVSEESGEEASAYDGSDASEDSGSASYDDVSDEGDDWDELERKAAKSDSKRADGVKVRGESDDSDDDRPKKKKGAAPAKGGAKGKANGKR
ncbi:FACT complex subunit SPT16 [Boletus reticuloceps]|uniref:FACT complex subunit n=1 Tax=Boletus reticuloceps TaxID=495285 RepID=A0A8I3AEB4_9AGAM|nr:FACT complex subunit SPT16 [Boletus reticuloceps]